MRKKSYVASLLAVPVLAAAALATLSFQPGSRVWIQGTSTARSYRCESTSVEGTAAATTASLAELRSIPRAEVSVPLASLDCRNNTMNGHMRRALKADANPTIRFRATSITVTPGEGGAATARMSGDLTIAGQTRPVSIDASVVEEDGQLRVRGTEQITMTDYGVQPPSLMLGTMRVRPLVTVGFDVVLKP